MNQIQTFAPGFSTKLARVIVEIIWYLAWLAILISLILVVAVNFTGFYVKYTRAPLEIDYQTEKASMSGYGQKISTSEVKIVKALSLQVMHHKKGLQRFYVLIPFTLALLLLGIVTILRSVIRSIRGGTPFTLKNASRIKMLGFLVMAAGPFYGLMEYIYGAMLKSSIDLPGKLIRVNSDNHIMYVGLGLLILVIGQVFKYGVRLREDSELTI